jgi:hypothetical protein
MSAEVEFKEFVMLQWRTDVERTRRYLSRVTGDLTRDELDWQARPGHHSIWHHVWHMFLVFDYYFSNGFEVETVWESEDWASKMDLSGMPDVFAYSGFAEGVPGNFLPRFTICEVPDDLVDDLKAPQFDQFLEYVHDVFDKCTAVLERAPESQLSKSMVVGGKPTQQMVVEYGIAFAHIYRHLGMIEDTKGLMRRPGAGSATI